MAVANPYINFNGNCEEAFNFYRSIFGGEFLQINRFHEVPKEHSMPEVESDKILHVSLPLGGDSILMGSDVPGAFPNVVNGTNFNISLNTDSEEEATTLFNALSSGGQITMPLDKTFWGSFFGMLVDKFGIQWMVTYDLERP